MEEAASALALEYPGVYSLQELMDHIEDLLRRFKNQALGDTVFRVGRDLPRKLSRDDRLVGAMLLCARRGLPFAGIAEVYRAALGFTACNEHGQPFPEDARFHAEYPSPRNLTAVSGLNPNDPVDKRVWTFISGGPGGSKSPGGGVAGVEPPQRG
jgi:mannitol-1-phosphate 5-dehydrogenase